MTLFHFGIKGAAVRDTGSGTSVDRPPAGITGCILLAILFALFACPSRAAVDGSASFEAANKLYEQGQYADAASAYERILKSGFTSSTLYFNYGNALFKSGQIGRAIVAYRQAEQLTPRDPDVRANLQFARNQVQGPTLRQNRWERWLRTLSLNEWTWLGTVAVWLTLLLLAAMELWPSLKPVLRRYTAAACVLGVFVCACFGLVLANRLTAKTAVVIAPDTVVRTGPLEESKSAFTANDGSELRVLDRKDDWLQVHDGLSRVGWLQVGQVALIAGS